MERPIALELLLQATCLDYFKKYEFEKHPFMFFHREPLTGGEVFEQSAYCTHAEAEAIITELLDKGVPVQSSVYGCMWAMRTKGVDQEPYDTLANMFPNREEQKPIDKL